MCARACMRVYACGCPLQTTDALRPEQDISSKDRVCSPQSRSITGNVDITTASVRPVLTRQGKGVIWKKDSERKHPSYELIIFWAFIRCHLQLYEWPRMNLLACASHFQLLDGFTDLVCNKRTGNTGTHFLWLEHF